MSFSDKPLLQGLVGKTVSGLALSQTALMTLEVASGSVALQQDGVTYTLASAQSHVFTSDATFQTQCFIGLIDNGATTDIWVDEYVDDGFNTRGAIPAGYELISAVGWFAIPVNETDLANATINRRVWQ